MNKNNYKVNNEHAEIQNIQKEKQYILTLEEGIKLQINKKNAWMKILKLLQSKSRS